MTYCLAMRLHEGLVFLADTRTNAGIDNISTYRKLHVLRPAPDRVFVLESAGNLATTQEVLDRIQGDLDTSGDHESLATVGHLFEAALYVGRLSREVAARHRDALSSVGADGTATFILGGQIGTGAPDILLVYPEGNYIRASDDRPFLQIGETKYGKFMLDLAVKAHVGLRDATKIALGSMMSTTRSNLSVGPPYDVAIYRNDSLMLEEFRFEADSPLLSNLENLWEKHLLNAVAELPHVSRDDFTGSDIPQA
jgi:putative proteasome-type protease